jgi:hypothetical protein
MPNQVTRIGSLIGRLSGRKLLLLVPVVLLLAAGATFAAFTSQSDNPGNSVAAAPDYRAPTVSPMVIGKSAGGVAGYIKQGGGYRIYADIVDTGNPASGILSRTADTSVFDTGQTAVAFTAGSFPFDGHTYGFRSAALTANAAVAAGLKTWSITSADNASNSATTNGSVTVDNTAPTAGTTSPPGPVQATNVSGGTAGKAEAGDTLTLTASEPLEPVSILAGWDGTATPVTLRLNQVAGSDTVTIFNTGNTAQLPLGTVTLGRTDYTTVNRTFASTMTMSGNDIVIVLGTASGAVTTAAANGTASWTPSATATDRASNAMATTVGTETGTADPEF